MSFAEEDAYNKVFQDLLEEIGSLPEYQDMTETLDRFRVLVAYNVLGGKQIRYQIHTVFHIFTYPGLFQRTKRYRRVPNLSSEPDPGNREGSLRFGMVYPNCGSK